MDKTVIVMVYYLAVRVYPFFQKPFGCLFFAFIKQNKSLAQPSRHDSLEPVLSPELRRGTHDHTRQAVTYDLVIIVGIQKKKKRINTVLFDGRTREERGLYTL